MNTVFSAPASESANHSLNLTYTRHGDYYLPDFEAPEAPRIGKFGAMRHDYLRTWHRGVFDAMLLKGTLNAHLEEIDRHANEMFERLTTQLAKVEGVTEQLKADNQLEWLRRMNNIRNRAMEIINNDLIYA